MRFLRTLLNSGVFMIILLAAATLYLVYSDEIKREHGIDTSEHLPVEQTAPVAVQEEVTPSVAVAAPIELSQPAPASVVSVPQEPIQAEPAFETQPPQVSSTSPMMPAPMEMSPMPAMPAPMEMPPMPAMPAPMEMPPMSAMPAPMEMPPVPASAPSRLDQARAALFDGNLDAAKQAYMAELSVSNDPDLHGELGNVYFAQQNWQDAASEYALAINGLTAQGRFLQAQYVLGFLMQINPEMGQKAMTDLRAKMYPQSAH